MENFAVKLSGLSQGIEEEKRLKGSFPHWNQISVPSGMD